MLWYQSLQNYIMSETKTYSSFSDRKSKKQKPSKVLLVCVYQTVIFQLTNELIFEKFCSFGHIIKILIFQKGQVTKFFIQYDGVQQACQAKNHFDGSKFFDNICKMNIYFSNFNNVDLKHESTQGADYESIEQNKSKFLENFDILTKSSQQQNIDFLDDDILMRTFSSYSSFGSSNSFVRSKTDNPRSLQSEISKMQSSSEETMNMIEQEQIDYSIRDQIQSLLSEGQSSVDYSLKNIASFTNSPKKHVSMYIKPQVHGKVNEQTILTYDKKQNVSIRQIYNLFSNFGNIELIVVKQYKVYIKFRSAYFAAVAFNYLNGMSFIGNLLNLQYCQNEQEAQTQSEGNIQWIRFEENSDRFTAKRSITVNPPSEVLHVSSIKKEKCNQNALRKIFQSYGKIQRVKILMQSNQKNMALIKFNSLKQSFQAISDLHNKQFGGRKIQISFTKSKL